MAAPQDVSDHIPLLDFETIVSAISEVSDGNVTVTVEELKKLKQQQAITIYKALLFAYNESVSEQINQVQLRDMDRFRYPRIFEDTTGLCTLAIALNEVMQSCGISNFVMKDILAPKPKRTHKLLSAFVNRIQFCFTKNDVLDNAFRQSDEIRGREFESEDRKTELINRIAELKAKKAEDQKAVANLTPETDLSTAQLHKALDKMEVKKKHMTDKVRLIEEEGVIVEMLKAKSLINESDAISIEKSSLLNRLSYKEREIFDLEEHAKTALRLINNLTSVLKKHKDTTKSLEDIKDRVATQEQNFKNLAAVFQNMKRQENSKHEKLTRINVQHRKVHSSTIEAIELEKKKRSAMKNDVIMKIRNRLEEVENEERAISETIDVEKLGFQNKMKNAADFYGQILDQLDIFHHDLTKGWEMTCPYFAEIQQF